ncbi:MAG: hypothetical protein ABUS79_01065 [Pseudomonadota bacterium]
MYGFLAGREVGLFGYQYLAQDIAAGGLVVTDRCGRARWRRDGPDLPTPHVLAHHDDLISIGKGSVANSSRLERHSKDGSKLASMQLGPGYPSRISVGSDGTLYVLMCGTVPEGQQDDDGLELVALGPELVQKWRMPFPNSFCRGSSLGTLGPDGVYYFVRGLDAVAPNMELVAIRTQSPTTAKTSWPDTWGNAAGNRWVLTAQ